MTDPVVFDSASPRFGLPLLFAGQAQKEIFVNEALSLVDGLLHCAIEGEIASPPTSPADGQAWLVATGASGAWAGEEGKIALRQQGQWLFASPCDGMRLLNKQTGQLVLRRAGAWAAPTPPVLPAGGSTVDSEARAAVVALVTALKQAGIFAV